MIHSQVGRSQVTPLMLSLVPAADHFQPYLIALPEMVTLYNKSVKYDMI